MQESKEDSKNEANPVESCPCMIDEVLTICKVSQFSEEWLLDFGASHHLSPYQNCFSPYQVVDGGSVIMGNTVSCKIVGVGSIRINMLDVIVRTLTIVRHVLELKKNLNSLGFLDSKGYKFAVQGGALQVFRGSLVVMKAMKIRNLYKLEGKIEISEVVVVSKNARASTFLWHQRLDHMNKKWLGLQLLVRCKLFPDFQSFNLCKFYICVGYSDGVKGCILWDPTARKIITSRDMYMEQSIFVQDHKGRFVCKLKESLYGLKVPRKLYKMFDPFLMSQNFLRSEYNHCVYFESLENGTFIFLVLYDDDMLIASQSMFRLVG
jgi:hypothetical protein